MIDSGIYMIKNLANGKFYIGSTINFDSRCRSHFKMLRNNRHYNNYLQNSCNRYGAKNFVFEIIEHVENVEVLLEKEQEYIDKLKPAYNISPVSKSQLGYKHTKEAKEKISKSSKGRRKGHKVSEETRKKMSESRKNRKLSPKQYEVFVGYWKGKKRPLSHRESISKGLKGHKPTYNKLTEKQVAEIKLLINKGDMLLREIGDLYGVKDNTISRIKTGQAWNFVEPKEEV